MATEQCEKPIWRMKVRTIVLDWLRCRGLPASALVEFEKRNGVAKVILNEPPPKSELTTAEPPQ